MEELVATRTLPPPSMKSVIALTFNEPPNSETRTQTLFLVFHRSWCTAKNKITAPFNNAQTLKFKAQPTNAFFATINQMFGGSSQLPTTTKRGNHIAVHSSDNKAVLGSSFKLGGAAEHLIDRSKKHICRLTSELLVSACY